MSIGILPNVTSITLNRDAKQGTSAYPRTTRLKNNQVKRQKTAITLKTERAKTRVVSLKTRSQESFGDQFDEYDTRSPRYVKQVSENIRDRRLEKYKSKFFISEVPTL